MQTADKAAGDWQSAGCSNSCPSQSVMHNIMQVTSYAMDMCMHAYKWLRQSGPNLAHGFTLVKGQMP